MWACTVLKITDTTREAGHETCFCCCSWDRNFSLFSKYWTNFFYTIPKIVFQYPKHSLKISPKLPQFYHCFLKIFKISLKFYNFFSFSVLTLKISPKLRIPFPLKFFKVFFPPEAIPLSDRPGHFFSIRFLTWPANGHTTVSQTRFFSFFFRSCFRPRRQWPYHSLSDRFFF